ncbi:DUF6148 family protein [Bradyrhizobium sp.]|uniref:DUF6148 family protein n=1 Tax=Bradyrhizobium sp. TaxID=376 RepID=UPI0025B9B543|nr:DUF6148 family protein [Bradyrhizobium sp.]
MSVGITLAQAQAQLAAWLAASSAVATGQEYEIDTGAGRRRLKRADASEIRHQIDYWQAKVSALTVGGRRRVRYVVPQ